MLPDHALHLRLADTRVTVRSNSAQLLQELGGHYREFSGQGGAADILVTVVETGPLSPDLPFAPWTGEDDAAKEEFADLPDGRIVRKRRTGLLLVFGPAGHFVLGPCRRHLDQVVNAINARFADRQFRAGAALFHAAAVCLGEAAVAVAGFAGAGKSTLALEIMRHGASFVSNDRLLVGPVPGFGRDGLMVTGIPRMPRVNPGTLLHNDRHSHPRLFRAGPVSAAGRACRPGGPVLATGRRGGACSLDGHRQPSRPPAGLHEGPGRHVRRRTEAGRTVRLSRAFGPVSGPGA
jgi:HprK-related kinase B